jgi:hypothetical protein
MKLNFSFIVFQKNWWMRNLPSVVERSGTIISQGRCQLMPSEMLGNSILEN